MSDQVRTIRGIIDEHEAISDQIRQAVRSIEDWQITLESRIAGDEALQIEDLAAKQWSLVQAIGFLEQGMLGHFQREEHELHEFIGPVILEALRIQHSEILEQLQTVRLLLTGTNLKSMNMTELARKYPNVKKELEDTYRLIDDHGRAEDITLRLVLKGILPKTETKSLSSQA